MIKLIIILLFVQAEQWILFTKDYKKEGVMAVYGNTIWVRFDRYATETFTIINRENDAHLTYYYVQNEHSKGSIVIKQDRIIFSLFVGKEHFVKVTYLKIYKS